VSFWFDMLIVEEERDVQAIVKAACRREVGESAKSATTHSSHTREANVYQILDSRIVERTPEQDARRDEVELFRTEESMKIRGD
jgi:hypothetical protein